MSEVYTIHVQKPMMSTGVEFVMQDGTRLSRDTHSQVVLPNELIRVIAAGGTAVIGACQECVHESREHARRKKEEQERRMAYQAQCMIAELEQYANQVS
ncbi:hypothetical protein MHT86_08005 [Corynebacterium mastitidis]|uniref:Uncharacterized protein n=1 Tax=Corynebacterium mastitidis TaxID=161890 RepID=A0A2N0X8X9_9CORY|nr:hypothetical protein [Corynebacterium mastitidis]MCH6197436.1 hypothetical protein [Corynebacterium mastitidis]PKF69160.1 hypothetical protein CXB45_03170 [Corynebacterium mastitidis]